MSADNWAVCPKCLKESQDEWAKDHEELLSKYGKIDAEEFVRLKINFPPRPEWNTTEASVREDYEIFFKNDDLTFNIYYIGECIQCGWGHKHESHTHLTLNSKPEVAS